MAKIILLILLCYPAFSWADKFEQNATYQLCFTPQENCTGLIVSTINAAKKEIYVQAYSFTSTGIAKALINAQKRGVKVNVLLDKSQYRPKGFSAAKLLSDYHIPAFIDYQPNIAHNKVIIIDSKTVITGSFNFTRAAQERNTENVIIIEDSQIAKKYLSNWQSRRAVSVSIAEAM